MHIKDFDSWNKEKQNLDSESRTPFFKERGIWWCVLGVNVGAEMDGKNAKFLRPVLILKHISEEIILIIPLTTKYKDTRYHFPVMTKRMNSFAKISQIRVVSSKRLFRKMDTLDKTSFKLLKKAIIDLLF